MNYKLDKLTKGLAQSVVRLFKKTFFIPVLVAGLQRQSLLLFGWLLLATPVGVQAQFTYATNNGGITITGYTGTNPVVIIPSTIGGLPVTSIGGSAFYRSSITSVTIPNSVTSIGDSAFYYCRSLTNIAIGNSVSNIADNACNSCPGLTSVTIPNSVTSIGDGAFAWCSMLTNIIVDPLNPAVSSVDGVLFNQNQTTLVQCPGGKPGAT